MSPPPSQPTAEVISGGSSSLVRLLPGGAYIEKTPHEATHNKFADDLAREYMIYQTLPRHDRLLSMHVDSSPIRLVLPYLRNGTLKELLADLSISPSQRLQLAADAAEGLEVLHNTGIIHCDLNIWNYMVDDSMRLCIIDFAGSTMNGKAGSGLEGFRYYLPRSFNEPSSVRTDLFALGSVIYAIATGGVPYEGKPDEEVEGCFRRLDFPCTEHLQLGPVVLGCWRQEYQSALQVLDDIRALETVPL